MRIFSARRLDITPLTVTADSWNILREEVNEILVRSDQRNMTLKLKVEELTEIITDGAI